MNKNISFIKFNNGRLCNQIYYALQAFIRSTHEQKVIYCIDNNEVQTGVYNMLCNLGLACFIKTNYSNNALYINSYCQHVGVDFTIQQEKQLIQKYILTSKIFSNINYNSINNENDIALHIKNGDYLLIEKNGYHDCFNRLDYLQKAIYHPSISNYKNVTIFSDDVDLCEKLYGNILRKRFININISKETSTEIEFAKLSLFKNKILWNSTFSYWSAFISDVIYNDTCNIICPSKFTLFDKASDRVDPCWIQINV